MPKSIVTITMNPAIDWACTVPEFSIGAVNRVSNFQADPGGKGVNMAKLLRQFDLPVTVTGFIGADNPDIFEKLFKERAICDAFVRVPGETRTGIKILDPVSHSTTDINFPGPTIDLSHLDLLRDKVRELSKNASIVILAGSIPPGVGPEVITELVTLIKKQGALAVVDTSGPAFSQALAACPSLIKPNEIELSEFAGQPLQTIPDMVLHGKKLLAKGIKTVVISMGANGALFLEGEQVLRALPPQVKPVSTVGAGDAMVAGLCAGHAIGLSFEERARLSTAVSASVVTRPGPDLPNLDLAEQLRSQVIIESLKI